MDCPAGQLEWLETGHFGSFAFGCVDRKLRRKYHSLFTVREPGRGDAWNVLAEMRESVTVAGERVCLADPLGGEAGGVLVAFEAFPVVEHRYRALDIEVTRTVQFGDADQLELHYIVRGVRDPVTLEIEPLLRCRAIHALTQENPFLDGSFTRVRDELHMTPYAGMPAIAFRIEGSDVRFVRSGRWLNDVVYPIEAERGYEAREDLFAPGQFVIELDRDASFVLVVGLEALAKSRPAEQERPRPNFATKLEHAARQFLMRTQRGEAAIVAGYPWFGPWGRDTLIALPGLCLATGDVDVAIEVLETMERARIGGLVPNIPALGDNAADTSSVDASLLFIRAVQWLGTHAGEGRAERFMPAVCEILEALADGSDPRMRFDHALGVELQGGPWALTWMDAMIDGVAVTPRAGFAVEVDALAYNAACFASGWASAHRPLFARAFRARLRTAQADFLARYWSDARGYFADTHDGARADFSLRPNQLFAFALPHSPAPDALAKAALGTVTAELLVPGGLRTLARFDRRYRGSYGGTQPARDEAYHQGTAWPWLLGIYADAVLRLEGRAALEARLSPALSFLAHHLDAEGCIGQLAEVFAGDYPHPWNGAPAQAWSVAEVYRALRMLHHGSR